MAASRSQLACATLLRAAYLNVTLTISILLTAAGCGSAGSAPAVVPSSPLQVNTTSDLAQPPAGTVTLRSAIEKASPADSVTFASSLNGATIQLSIVGEAHSLLPGEVYAPAYQGYSDRDYGKSAIYVRKDLTLDASALPDGVTIKWTGADADPARVLAVYGNLILKNVRITGGYSKAEPLADNTAQPYTLARGGGIAVWGTAMLENCAIFGNRISGDVNASRDRGAYGGGLYANGLDIRNCIITGNTADGYGAAGGGIYSVGGPTNEGGRGNNTWISGSSITGNRVTAQHAYGGGIFTLSGGPTNLASMTISNSTIARNLVLDNPTLPEVGQYYYRGGGVYMGGGSLSIINATIVENEVRGPLAMFSGKPNVGGGGTAATIGNAHVVENLTLQGSIIAGNRLNGELQDVFAGSLLNFYSNGYNLVGKYDFSQILVPVPDWMNLSRKHFPKEGDAASVVLSDVLALDGTQHSANLVSEGTDAGELAVLWYSPAGIALDRVPTANYHVTNVNAEYSGFGETSPGVVQDDFLNHVVQQVATRYPDQLGSDFASQFGDMRGVTWYGPAVTWPSNSANNPWIAFWRNLDSTIGYRLGPAILADDFWGTFTTGALCANEAITVIREDVLVKPSPTDQRNQARPKGSLGDIGAIER